MDIRHAMMPDYDHYDQSFVIYMNHTSEIEYGMKWWSKEMPDIVKRLASDDSEEPFRVLAVGTGNGKLYDKELLNILSSLNLKVIYTVVEPRQSALEEFQVMANSKYSEIQFKGFQTTFDHFQEKEWRQNGEKFNLIHFVHSLYYIISSWEMLRTKLVPVYSDMLKEGGAMVTFVDSQNGKKTVTAKGSVPSVLSWFVDMFQTPDLIGKLASEENWTFSVFNSLCKIDVSKCFNEKSSEGVLLLDFLTRTKDFRKSSSKENVTKVLKYLESQSELEENDTMKLPLKLDITVVWKEL